MVIPQVQTEMPELGQDQPTHAEFNRCRASGQREEQRTLTLPTHDSTDGSREHSGRSDLLEAQHAKQFTKSGYDGRQTLFDALDRPVPPRRSRSRRCRPPGPDPASMESIRSAISSGSSRVISRRMTACPSPSSREVARSPLRSSSGVRVSEQVSTAQRISRLQASPCGFFVFMVAHRGGSPGGTVSSHIMSILGHGIDLVEVERIEDMITRHQARFLDRCFTVREQAYCEQGGPRRAERYAARFAGSRAGLGRGLQAGLGWTQIEVVADSWGRPGITLQGEAARLAAETGIGGWHLSLTHVERASASVIAVADQLADVIMSA